MDRKRFAGPEGSVRPLLDPLIHPTSSKGKLLDTDTLFRQDGRYPEQLRPVTINMGTITRAPGSAYLEWGNSKLVCSVYGPRSASARSTGKTFQTLGNVSCEINYAPFAGTERFVHQPVIRKKRWVCKLVANEAYFLGDRRECIFVIAASHLSGYPQRALS